MKQTLLWLLLLTLVAMPAAFGQQTLAANPTSLTFSYQPGSTLPAAQIVTLTSGDGTAPPAFSYTWTAAPSVWFDVAAADSAHLQVRPNNKIGGLSIGTYSGSISVTPTAGGATLTIPVTLQVGISQTLTLTPSTLTFSYQTGNVNTQQSVAVSAGTTGTGFTATTTQSWLSVSPTTGTTPMYVTVTANPAGLANGTYTANVNFTASDNTITSLPVTFTVGTGSTTLSLTPTSLSFYYQTGNVSTQQSVAVSSSLSGIGFTAATNQTWLSVFPTSGTTPMFVTVTANPSGLPNGTYTGQVNFTATDNSITTLPVTFTVGTNTTSLNANPTSLTFNATLGGANPAAQSFTVSSGTGSGTTASASTNVNWLSVSPNTNFILPNSVTVTPNISQLTTAGTYKTNVTVTDNNLATVTVPVTVNLSAASAGATTTVSSFAPYYGTTVTQSFSATYNDAQGVSNISKTYIIFTNRDPGNGGQSNACEIEYSPGSGTIRLLGNDGVTWSGSYAVGNNGTNLANSQCQVNLAFSTQTFTGTTQVTLNVSVTFAPGFTGQQNISLQEVNMAGATNTWTSWGAWYPNTAPVLENWYRLYDPFSRSHHYTVDTNEYDTLGTRGFSKEGSSGVVYSAPATRGGIQAVPYFRVLILNTNVGAPTHLWTTDPNEYFTLIQNKSAFGGEGIAAFVFPGSGAHPADSIPLYRLAYTPPGPNIHHWTNDLNEYTSLASTGSWKQEGVAAYLLPVGTTSSAPVEVSALSDEKVVSVLNAANLRPGAISSGSRIRIVGRNLSPDTEVMIGGVTAKVLSVNENGADVLVPEGISGDETTIHVAGAERSRKVQVRQASPALFTNTVFGVGQAVAINADGSKNSPDSPAAKGSVVTLHATGVGSDPSAVKVLFNGLPASVLGVEKSADGLELIQVMVPEGLGYESIVPVRVQVGLEMSQDSVTFAVR